MRLPLPVVDDDGGGTDISHAPSYFLRNFARFFLTFFKKSFASPADAADATVDVDVFTILTNVCSVHDLKL